MKPLRRVGQRPGSQLLKLLNIALLHPFDPHSLLFTKEPGKVSFSLYLRSFIGVLVWCQRRDLNPRPKAYESSALPLSYSGNPKKRAIRIADAGASRQVLKMEVKMEKWKGRH